MALGWKLKWDQFVSPLSSIFTSRMVGVEVRFLRDDFWRLQDHLEAALSLLPPGAEFIVMGDFNADLGPLGGPKFCTEI